ncbi:MAG: dihydropteroate synthase-like protein [Candidatus Hermodarchaeia archaeon]
MKVLLVTGKLAEPLIRQILNEIETQHTFDVLVLPLAVAAFLHPKYVASQIHLRGPLEEYNLILLPGMVSGDTDLVKKSVGIPTFKGTRYAADLPLLLDNLFDVESRLSTTQPADLFLADQLAKKARQDLAKGEKGPKKPLPKGYMEIGKGSSTVLIGPRMPMRVIAEITDAPLRSEEELLQLAQYFVMNGAHILDVGMVAGAPDPDATKNIVKFLGQHLKVPLSIDSMDSQEITAGVQGGAQLVLSLDQDSMMDIPKRYRKRATYAVIPSRQWGAEIPKGIEERIDLLLENLSNARSLGFKQLIADPLCDPLIAPGLTKALQAYTQFKTQQPDVPLLMGVGNITELLDADSPGANAVLAGIAQELSVSLLLTTEVSPKTKGSVRELHRAAQMMYLARRRRSPPKDLGIDLFLFKTKRFPELPFESIPDVEYPKIDISNEALVHRLDATGYFTFHVNRFEHQIVARHYAAGSTEVPTIELRGSSAQQLIDAILTRDLVSQLDHAAYIGRELAKAELALKTGRPYIQETPLF